MNPLEQLGRDVAEELDRTPEPPGERARARAAFLAAASAPPRDGRSRRAALGVGGALAIAAATLLWINTQRAPAASFEVGGGEARAGEVGRWLEPTDSELPLRFSDGSTVLLTSGSRGRVDELTPRGATLSVDRGRAVVSVRHLPNTKWSVVAGPFHVAVTGTRFNVEWDPRVELFTLVMEDGSVLVRGPAPYESVPLVAGQTFRVSLAKPTTSAPPPDATSPPPVVEPPTEPSARRVTSTEPPTPTPSARAVDEPGWRDLALRGDYARAMQAVDRDGASTILASASATDLMLLGDAARFVGRTPLAREAYLTVRSRFAGSPAAAQAAFALGRLGSDALGWFQRYLAEAPDGPLAREALGRVLELQQSGGSPEAARTARRYLASFPSGPHAALAQSVLAREPSQPTPPPSASAP